MRNYEQMFDKQFTYYAPNAPGAMRLTDMASLAYEVYHALNNVSPGVKVLSTTYGAPERAPGTEYRYISMGYNEVVFADRYNMPIMRLEAEKGGTLRRGRGSRSVRSYETVYSINPQTIGGFGWSGEKIASTKPAYVIRKLRTALAAHKQGLDENRAEISGDDFVKQVHRALRPSASLDNFNNLLRAGLVGLGKLVAKNNNVEIKEDLLMSRMTREWLVRFHKGECAAGDEPVLVASEIESIWRKISGERKRIDSTVQSALDMFTRPKWLLMQHETGVYTMPIEQDMADKFRKYVQEWAHNPQSYNEVKFFTEMPVLFHQPRFDMSRMDCLDEKQHESLVSSLNMYELTVQTNEPALAEMRKKPNYRNTQGLFRLISETAALPQAGWIEWTGTYSYGIRALMFDKD